MIICQVGLSHKHAEKKFHRHPRAEVGPGAIRLQNGADTLQMALLTNRHFQIGRQMGRVDDARIRLVERESARPLGDVKFPRTVTPFATDRGLSGDQWFPKTVD